MEKQVSNPYPELRKSSPVYRDGLARRTEQVRAFLDIAAPSPDCRLLDVGTADGSMPATLRSTYPRMRFSGIEILPGLALLARESGLDVVRADSRSLPFADASFEVLVISATLKMVSGPRRALEECRRVLTPGGHLILLDVTPWGIRVGLWRGHFDPKTIPNIWSLSRTAKEVDAAGFRVLKSHRYMLLPVSAPGSRAAESFVRAVGLGGLLLQQSLLARAV